MTSDGLSMMNAEFSSSSFRVVPVVIGARNFLANLISYPPGGRTGDNCLLATKVQVPTHGPRRSNVGLLGSPCFEIPRSVWRDKQLDHLSSGEERQRRLTAKRRHNAVTMGLHLLVSYLLFLGVLLIAMSPLGGTGWGERAGTAAKAILYVTFPVVLSLLVERAVTGFRALQPRFCSIYQVEFWRHERYWKLAYQKYLHMFDGTPLKGLVWRLLGVQIGRRVFDDGLVIHERTLARIGDGSTFNMGSALQSHSLEDGTFKSDLITVGRGCTVGTGALMNYGVKMHDGSVLDADSFLMKGSWVGPNRRWCGNPASELSIPTVLSKVPFQGAREPVRELIQ
jgi:non-ribosomal peptide synthetase-like protein